MIDIHCHLLPGVDDGSDTMATSLKMARTAAESGVQVIIVTPHCNIPNEKQQNYLSDDLRARFYALHHAIRDAHIPLQIMPGMEIMYTPELCDLFLAGKLLTLAGSRYLLMEFYFDESAEFMDAAIEEVSALGIVPVIAHPERYHAVQSRTDIVENWFSKGYVIQVNKDSILGNFGSRPELAADRILSQGLAHIVASDAHGCTRRTAKMDDLRDYLSDIYSPEYAEILLRKNPEQILYNKPLIEAD